MSAIIVAADAATIVRALLRPHREPASRIAWIAVILALPIAGVILYLLVGEARVSGPRRMRGKEVLARLPKPGSDNNRRSAGNTFDAPFELASSIDELEPTAGNEASLAADSNAAIDE